MRCFTILTYYTITFASLLFAQVSNDECTSAAIITGVPFNTSQDTRLASVNLTDPQFNCNDTSGLGKTVWYKYTATSDTGIIFSTIGSTPTADFDVMLGLFTGTCGSLIFLDCNDDANGTRQSELYYMVRKGTTYYILLGEWGNGGTNGGVPTGGDLVFKVFYGNPPLQVKGPKLGTVSSGSVVSTNSFAKTPAQDEETNDLSPRVIENKEVEIKPHKGPLKVLPKIKHSQHQVTALAAEGSNYFEDQSPMVASISRPVITKDFLGIGQTNSIPPDPIMAVGPNHIIIMVNSSFRIFDKNGSVLKTIAASNFFNSVAPNAAPNDPQIVYDHFAKRFVMVWMTAPTTTDHRHLIAVSKDSNATGDWYMWNTSAIAVGDSATSGWGDYPALSFDQNAIYLTSNQFDLIIGAFLYTKLRIFDKSKLFSNTAGSISFQDFWDFKDPQAQSTPSNIRPMNGYSNCSYSFMMNVPNTSPANYMTLWTIFNPASSFPSITGLNVPVVQYSSPSNANQLGGGAPLIEAGANRIRANIIYRDSLLWAVHTIANGANSAVRYVKINPYTNSTLEDAALGLSGYWHFYPAIMVDENQNLLMTYSRSGNNEFAGAFVAGRKKNDPPGISSSVTMREGLGNYILTFTGTRNRWGDFNGIGLDPLDQSSIWTHTEFATTSNKWSTWVSKSKIGPLAGSFATLNRTAVNFGTKFVGQLSDTIEISITNDGLDTLTINSISNTNVNYQIIEKPAIPFNLGSLSVASFKILFKPTIVGALNDSIIVSTSDAEKPSQVIKLSGNGFTIAIAAPGTLFASSGSTDGGKLYTVNSGNGSAAAIGSIGLPTIASLRVHPTTKELIGYDPTGSSNGGAFYRISSDIKNTERISTTTISDMKGLAFENDSVAFVGTLMGNLYRVNYKTGAATQLGSNTGVGIAGLALNPINNTLWMSLRSNDNNADGIYKVNTTNGAVTKIGNAEIGTDIVDILFDKNGKLYGLTNSGVAVNNLIVIDTTTGTATIKGSLGKSNILAIALNPDAVASIQDQTYGKVPTQFTLEQNYPNPFNPMTTIKFSVPTTSKVVLRVYDAIGREVSTLADGYRQPGYYTEYFDASKLSSGIYYYKFTAGSFTEIKKMLFLK